MSDDMERWERDGQEFGWRMPTVAYWKTLPIIRHVRFAYQTWQVEQWYAAGPGSIGLRSGYDNWVLFGIFHAKDRPEASQ